MQSGSMLESALLQTHFDVIPFGIYVVDVATYELVFINRHYRQAYALHRLALHASSIQFPHPTTGLMMRVDAPLSEDLRVAFEQLGCLP